MGAHPIEPGAESVVEPLISEIATDVSDATRAVPREWVRLFELFAVFFGVPSLIYVLRECRIAVPTLPALIAGVAVLATLLLRDREFDVRHALRWRWSTRECWRILGLFVLGSLLVGLYTAVWESARFLAFPKQKPALWAAVMVMYPLLSVLPQELAFRVFFFHRYRRLLPTLRGRVVVSSLAFGFTHLVFDNWTSILLSTAGGFLFGWTYARRPSVWLVAFEHALWGCFLFTIGLGAYFYAGSGG